MAQIIWYLLLSEKVLFSVENYCLKKLTFSATFFSNYSLNSNIPFWTRNKKKFAKFSLFLHLGGKAKIEL